MKQVLGGNKIEGQVVLTNGGIILSGGAGDDTFVFNTSLTNIDTIYDFNHSDDTINLDNSIFTSLVEGALSADNLAFGTVALDANDFLIYDKNSGNLSYDTDGNGGGASVVFANFANKPQDIDYTDFYAYSTSVTL
ncbi:MAG: hypothetical protein IE878_05380 [Epsilonproteobacteria bacterium]|nr:hypothetical protein [Campylobacterota bacterium]MBD3839800.1 hypothetical protein [Campylobacterota bacterium]